MLFCFDLTNRHLKHIRDPNQSKITQHHVPGTEQLRGQMGGGPESPVCSSLGPLPGTMAAGEPRSRPRAWPPPWAPSTHCQLQEGPRGLGAVESSSG